MQEKNLLIGVFAAMMVAFAFFLLDVVIDIREHVISATAYLPHEVVHLLFEMLAVFALGCGIVVTFRYLSVLRAHGLAAEQSLYFLRNDFDALLKGKFQTWGFTDAEKEIGLLVLRGLTTAQIAELRQTKVGTVKLQIHKILNKANASSRTDFMALFIDEFLDFSADA